MATDPADRTNRFLAEATLGKLAKWLRLMGFDTCYHRGLRLEDAAGQSPTQRILLTRTRKTAERLAGRRVIFIRADRPEAQLEQVIAALGLTAEDARPFSRCLRCNRRTRPLPRDAARGKVPDYVWQTAVRFTSCSGCKRIYWPGTHTERALERLTALLRQAGADPRQPRKR